LNFKKKILIKKTFALRVHTSKKVTMSSSKLLKPSSRERSTIKFGQRVCFCFFPLREEDDVEQILKFLEESGALIYRMGTFFPFNDEPKRSIYFFAPKNVCDNIYDEIPTMREYSFKYIERMTDIERRTLITSFPIERLVEKGKRTKEEARDMFVKVIKDFVKEISVVTRTPASIEAVESGGKFIATIVFEEDLADKTDYDPGRKFGNDSTLVVEALRAWRNCNSKTAHQQCGH